MTATQQVVENVTAQTDPTVVIGKVLVRAKRIIWDIPTAIKAQMNAARDKGQETDEYMKLVVCRRLVRRNQTKVIADDATPTQVYEAVQKIKKLTAEKEAFLAAVRLAGEEHHVRVKELKSEMEQEKSELAKDYASEVITALLQ